MIPLVFFINVISNLYDPSLVKSFISVTLLLLWICTLVLEIDAE
jgi:hypothetical protein